MPVGARAEVPRVLEGLTKLTVVRWREHGRDRLLVTGADGERLGQLDLLTGVHRVVDPAARRAVEEAVRGWLQQHPGVRVQGHRTAPAPTPAEPPVPLLRNGLAVTTVLPAPVQQVPPLRRALRTGRRLAGAVGLPGPAGLPGLPGLPGLTARRGARGVRVQVSLPGSPAERRLVHRLHRLGPAWRVLPAVHVPTQDDAVVQLVVGPPGAFALRTHERPRARILVAGDVLVADGRRRDDLARVRALADQAAQRLGVVTGTPVDVLGVVVPLGAESVTVRRAPRGGAVVESRALRQWLRTQPPLLTPARVETLFEAAADPATWR